jgi:hypothetical protein
MRHWGRPFRPWPRISTLHEITSQQKPSRQNAKSPHLTYMSTSVFPRDSGIPRNLWTQKACTLLPWRRHPICPHASSRLTSGTRPATIPSKEPLPSCLRVRGQHGRSQDGVARERTGAEDGGQQGEVVGRQERASKARRALNDVNVVEGEGGIRRG